MCASAMTMDEYLTEYMSTPREYSVSDQTRLDSNWPAKLQKLVRGTCTVQEANNKGAEVRRLIFFFVVRI